MEKTGEKTNGVQLCKRLHFEAVSSKSSCFGSSKWFRKGLEFRWADFRFSVLRLTIVSCLLVEEAHC